MRRILPVLLAFGLCMSLVLAGCQRESGARQAFEEGAAGQSEQQHENSADGEEIPQGGSEAQTQQMDYDWYATRYICNISLQRMEDFASAADIAPDDLVEFFFMANYDGEDKLPIPEGYRSSTDGEFMLPEDDVESYVAAFFDGIDEGDMRASQYYDQDKRIYVLQGFGITSAGSRVEVTDVQTRDDRVELVFDVYTVLLDAEGEELEIGPVATRCASFLDQGDRFKVISLETLYQADMDKLMKEAGLA